MIILEPFMSKALPIAVAVVLGGAALVPVYYATQHPTTEVGRKADKNASPIQKSVMFLGMKLLSKLLLNWIRKHLFKGSMMRVISSLVLILKKI